MTREDLFEAIGNLDDGTLESNIVSFPRKKQHTARWIGLAASVVIVASAILILPRALGGAGSKSAAPETAGMTEAAEEGQTESIAADGSNGYSVNTVTEETMEEMTETSTETQVQAMSSDSEAPADTYAEVIRSQEVLEADGLYGFEILYNYFGLDDSLKSVTVTSKDSTGLELTEVYDPSLDAIREFMKYVASSEISEPKAEEEAEPVYTVTLQLKDEGEVTLGLMGEGRVVLLDDTVYSEEEAFWRGRMLTVDKEVYDRFVETVIR